MLQRPLLEAFLFELDWYDITNTIRMSCVQSHPTFELLVPRFRWENVK